MRLTIPTVLSLARVPLGIAFVVTEDAIARAGIIVAAGISDWLDGRLARALHQDSRTGEVLDPITDRIFAMTTLGALTAEGTIRVWELFILLSRDIATTIGFVIAHVRRLPIRFRARFSGKTVTVLQVAALFAFTLDLPGTLAAVLLVGIASVWAIADYAHFAATSLRRPLGAGG